MKVNIIAEIGINAVTEEKGKDVDTAVKLIQVAALSGADYVKFQKRDPDKAVPPEKKNQEKIVPWRKDPTTYLQYKKDIEFDRDEYLYLSKKAKENNIGFFASVWDIESAQFMTELTQIVKIPSAHITNKELLQFCKENFRFRIMSSGMSNEQEVAEAVSLLQPHVLMHTNSAYPTPVEELNLRYIEWIKDKWPHICAGYSNHYYGIIPTIASIYLGAKWVEAHITMDHAMWGSDQKSSIEPSGFFKLVKGIRDLSTAYTGYEPREVFPSELKKREDLRGC